MSNFGRTSFFELAHVWFDVLVIIIRFTDLFWFGLIFGNWYLPLYVTLIYLTYLISLQYLWYLSGKPIKYMKFSGSELHLRSLISVNFRACTRSKKKKWVERTQKDSFIFRSKTHRVEQLLALCTNPGVGDSRSGDGTDNTEFDDGLTFGGKCSPYKISKCHSNNDCKLSKIWPIS